MLTKIASIDELEKESAIIQTFLDQPISDDGHDIQEAGNKISVYMSRTGKMLADAKYHQDVAVKGSILHELKENIDLPASTLNALVKASSERENHLVNWLDRLNRTCTHRLDWLRSVLSKIKSERLRTY